MKITILKFLFLLFIFSLTIGCSSEAEDAPEQELITANLFGDQALEFPCVDPDLEIGDYGVTYIFVEYEPGLSREEKHQIRAPYCGNMISIEPCDINPNGELWTVRGPCNGNTVCQPGVVPPVDPDLRQSAHFSECQYPDPGLFINPDKQQ